MKEEIIATFNRPKPAFGGGGNRFQDRRFPRPKVEEHRINDRIRVPQVRLVGENVESQICDTDVALRMAQDMGLDLVEISDTTNPPVCRIVDYQKFLYEKKKKDKEQKAKAAKSIVKEIRFGPNTDDHDFDFKLKHAIKFLEDGAKVKAYVHFKGRTIAYKEKGEIILLKFAQELAEYAKVELLPKLEGNRMFLHLAPLPKKK